MTSSTTWNTLNLITDKQVQQLLEGIKNSLLDMWSENNEVQYRRYIHPKVQWLVILNTLLICCLLHNSWTASLLRTFSYKTFRKYPGFFLHNRYCFLKLVCTVLFRNTVFLLPNFRVICSNLQRKNFSHTDCLTCIYKTEL